MASLLFDGRDNLKVSSANTESMSVQFSMYNDEVDSEQAYLTVDVDLEGLEILKDWIYEQIKKIENHKKI